MCVKLTYQDDSSKEYDPNLPVEVQLKSIRSVKIRWDKKDCNNVNLFLTDLNRAMHFKLVEPFEVEVDHGDSLDGARAKKKAINAMNEMAVCWLIKELVNTQQHLDKKLENISKQMKAMVR